MSEEEKEEFHDSHETIEIKAKELAELILKSKHFIAFTGAGISTSAGIPDYRSGINTKVPTGPGQYETDSTDSRKTVHLDQAMPTFTHMALSSLSERNLLKFLITQNVDNLHLKSGLNPNHLAELHGNANKEKCISCEKEYNRDYKVRKTGSKDHLTGNICDDDNCKGYLLDTIIHFGDSLNKSLLSRCLQESQSADLCLVLGSSIRVRPAALFPGLVSANGKLVIVNLQKTPFDDVSLKIHSFCDPLMKSLMKNLGITVNEFKSKKRFLIAKDSERTSFIGLDPFGNSLSIFKKVTFGKEYREKPPFVFFNTQGLIELEFFSHFGEKKIFLENKDLPITGHQKIFEFEFDWKTSKWLSLNK
jgi:NAD-dependent SIR2 family protein deacetylase